MPTTEQLKQFINQLIDLHKDNFIELLNNPEFQKNELKKKVIAVNYVTALFKKQLEENINTFFISADGGSLNVAGNEKII